MLPASLQVVIWRLDGSGGERVCSPEPSKVSPLMRPGGLDSGLQRWGCLLSCLQPRGEGAAGLFFCTVTGNTRPSLKPCYPSSHTFELSTSPFLEAKEKNILGCAMRGFLSQQNFNTSSCRSLKPHLPAGTCQAQEFSTWVRRLYDHWNYPEEEMCGDRQHWQTLLWSNNRTPSSQPGEERALPSQLSHIRTCVSWNFVSATLC